ncbi:MAG: DNA mismatch repair endonuclease MutL [Desulfonatronovibrionaceae bacterium]
MSIRILPPELQNQIAAGEVVERPASVVKELLENSLDAGAGNVQVSISQGGQELIRVKDDGQGMAAGEIPLALTRHATSKIQSLPDLERIKSFGFRGEALPSIASVSRLEMKSITPDSAEGYCLEVDQGQVGEGRPVALDKGTEVTVKNLFSNTPARLKFLKTVNTEHKKCLQIFSRMALARPQTDFEFFVRDKSIRRFYAGQDLAARLKEIWPQKVCEGLQDFYLSSGDWTIHGLAGRPDTAQGRADRIYFYVNNRPVADKMLLSAVRAAYKGSLLSREYPQAVVFIDLPFEEVDVNTHPAKTEVRFFNESEIFTLVKKAVAQIFGPEVQKCQPSKTGLNPAHPCGTKIREPETRRGYGTGEGSNKMHLWSSPQPEPDFGPEIFGSLSRGQEEESPPKTGVDLRYLGQILDTYLLADSSKGLVILDQHAMHERILYEDICRRKENPRQKKLLLPLEIAAKNAEKQALARVRGELLRLGFSFKTGQNSLTLTAVPEWLSPEKGREYVRDILSDREPDSEKMLITLSCKSAIKAGQKLTRDEALGLISKWLRCPNKDFCPHGRPVSSVWDGQSLEKLFKRT